MHENLTESPPTFPNGFLWGTATSPTQVEGHVRNEWTDYVAQDGGHCRISCDHYHRYREDVDLMASLGVNAYRMGIEWSRLQSAPYAPLDERELARYRDLLDCLQSSGITPMVVLHHFTNPTWISASGGWLSPATVPIFVDYAAKLVSALRDRVYIWNTFNEPDTYASLGYLLGGFPPHARWNLRAFRKVIRNMADAHVQISRIILQQGNSPNPPQVGIAKNWTFFDAYKRHHIWDRAVAAVCHKLFNDFVLDAFLGGERRGDSTYLGVNYYGLARFKLFKPLVPAGGASPQLLEQLGVRCDDMFERHPAGLGVVLRDFHQRYQLPIYITEHGSASQDDAFRIHDLKEHLSVLHHALKSGVDVRGFFYWSLMDNFEWQFGYTKRFGLLSVDFNDRSLPRRMTRLAEFYRTICSPSKASNHH